MFSARSCSRSKGFALAELVMVLGVVGMASLLIAALVSQVLKINQKASQTGAILEFRNKVSVITKNPESWLNKMRTRSVYAACIPQSDSIIFNSGNLKCPSVMESAGFKESDATLAKISGDQLHIASAPILDIFGEPLAGTIDEPLYFDTSGRICDDEKAATRCLFKSVGYFLRTNPSDEQQPGNIKFIVKIEKNNQMASANKNSFLFKPEYLSIDIGEAWKNPDSALPIVRDLSGVKKKVIKIGYRLDGEALYTSPGVSCSSGIMTGINEAGQAQCASYPTGCAGESEAIFDSKTSQLVCSSTNFCGTGQVFLGYVAGTGAPMCSTGNLSCADNEVQIGVSNNDGRQKAVCKVLPSCADSKILSYDGSEFICMQDLAAKSCGADEVMIGVNADGSLNCKSADRTLTSTSLSCPDGKVVSSIAADGSVTCKSLDEISNTRISFRCPAGKSVVGFNADGSVICEATSPIVGNYSQSWQYGKNPVAARAPRGKSVTFTTKKPTMIVAKGYIFTVPRDANNKNLKVYKTSVRARLKVNGIYCGTSDATFADDRYFAFINDVSCVRSLPVGTHTLTVERLVGLSSGIPNGYAKSAGQFRSSIISLQYMLLDAENSLEKVDYQEVDVTGDGEDNEDL